MFEESSNKNDYIKLKEVKDVLKCKGIKEKYVIGAFKVIWELQCIYTL